MLYIGKGKDMPHVRIDRHGHLVRDIVPSPREKRGDDSQDLRDHPWQPAHPVV